MNLKRFRLRPRWRKVLFDLWDNKPRTALVVISIAIGVFAVGMIAGAYTIIANDMNASYAAANPGNIEIITSPFDDDLVKSMENLPGVHQAEGRRAVTVRVQSGPNEWNVLRLESMPDFDRMKIDVLLPQEGRLAPGKEQVVLERQALEKINAKNGDLLQIELSDGTRKELPVVGVVIDRTSGMDGLVGDPKGYITTDTLEWLHQPRTYNILMVTVAEGANDKNHLEQMSFNVTNLLEKSGREAYRTELFQTNKHPLDSIVKALLGVLLVLGILIVFLSGSLIANTLTALLNQHLRQIGVMKLIGARSSQVIKLYLALILSFSLIALIIAIPTGNWAALALSRLIGDLLNVVLQPHSVLPLAILFQVIIAIGAPLLAGIAPVMNGARVTVLKAINSTGMETENGRKSRIDQWTENVRGLSRPILISLRNTFRHKGRLALTLFNLTLGGAIFISVFNVRVALNNQIQRTTKYFRADVNLNFDRPYRIEQVAREVESIPGVSRVEGWAITSAELTGRKGSTPKYATVFAPPASSDLVSPILLQGRWLMPGDENAIAVNEAFWSEYPNLKVGDRLRLKMDNREQDWTIVGIFQYTGLDMLFAYTNYEYLSRVLNQTGQASTYRVVTTDHSRSFQEQVSSRIDSRLKDRGYRVSKTEAGNVLIETVFDYINILILFLLIMALLTAAVGGIGLAGTLSMNVLERTREIGVLRAIGAYDRLVMKLVIVEGLLISLISYALGALLSFPITTVLSDIVSQAIFNSPSNFAFTGRGFIIWLIAVVVLSILASVVPARSASRMTIREVLAYE